MTIHRRGLLTESAVALAGAAAGTTALAEGAGPDAELLRLGVLREQAKADVEAAADNDERDAFCEIQWDLEVQIHRIPAMTIAGLGVKAKLAFDYVPAPVRTSR